MVVDVSSETFSLLDLIDVTNADPAVTADRFGASSPPVLYQDKLYCIPLNWPSIVIIDTTTNEISQLGDYVNAECCKYYSCSGLVGEKVYAFPGLTSSILIIDVSSDTWSEVFLADSPNIKFMDVPVLVGEKLYGVPFGHPDIVILNTLDNSLSTISGYTNSLTSNAYSASTLVGNKIYAVPNVATQILIIDTTNDSFSYLAGWSNGNFWKYAAIPILAGHKLYCSPTGSQRF
jgi:hypothetical protein